MHKSENYCTFVPKFNTNTMILFTDSLFLTDEKEGFRICRETRTTCTATMTAMYVEDGYIDVYYHGAMMRIEAGEMFIRIPDFSQPLGPYEMSDDFKFKQLTISAGIFDQIMYDHMRLEPNWWAKQEYMKRNPKFKISDLGKDFFSTYFHLLHLQMLDEMTDYRKQIMFQMAKAAMMELFNYMDKFEINLDEMPQARRASVNHSDYIFREFMRLLQLHPHKREVQWYAKQMDITPKYLSEVCKDRSRKSAGKWVAEITVAELKHYLQNTTIPIREVANIMEFPNASFFCQYTKKHLGETPNHYRKKRTI